MRGWLVMPAEPRRKAGRMLADLRTILQSPVGGLTIGYLQDLVPHRTGAGSSLISVGGFLGALMASAVFAVGVRTFGYAGAALLGGALVLVGGTLSFFGHDR
ncbi:MAG TPA: hypothetical protein VGC99_24860 [Candidatus Tectomicrobia bacterium]